MRQPLRGLRTLTRVTVVRALDQEHLVAGFSVAQDDGRHLWQPDWGTTDVLTKPDNEVGDALWSTANVTIHHAVRVTLWPLQLRPAALLANCP